MPSNIAPYLTVDGAARAIEWYEKVLGARCSFQMPAENDDRIMHSTLIVRGSVFNLADAFPEVGGHPAPDMKAGSPVAIGLTLETPAEVDRIFALAIAEGGSQSHPPEDMFWGDRFCQFHDPFGHRWMLRAELEGRGEDA